MSSEELEIKEILLILKSKIVFFAVTFILLFVVFSAIVLTQPKEYFSSIPITITKSESKYVISDLKTAAKYSKSELVSNLNFSNEMVEGLNFIQVTNTNNENDRFYATINISTESSELLKPISDKLIKWSNSNPDFIKNLNKKKELLKDLIRQTNVQLFEIKKIKEVVLVSSNTNNNIFEEENNILKTQRNLKQEMEGLNNVTRYASQYFTPQEPINKPSGLHYFLCGIGALLLSVFITFVRYKG